MQSKPGRAGRRGQLEEARPRQAARGNPALHDVLPPRQGHAGPVHRSSRTERETARFVAARRGRGGEGCP